MSYVAYTEAPQGSVLVPVRYPASVWSHHNDAHGKQTHTVAADTEPDPQIIESADAVTPFHRTCAGVGQGDDGHVSGCATRGIYDVDGIRRCRCGRQSLPGSRSRSHSDRCRDSCLCDIQLSCHRRFARDPVDGPRRDDRGRAHVNDSAGMRRRRWVNSSARLVPSCRKTSTNRRARHRPRRDQPRSKSGQARSIEKWVSPAPGGPANRSFVDPVSEYAPSAPADCIANHVGTARCGQEFCRDFCH